MVKNTIGLIVAILLLIGTAFPAIEQEITISYSATTLDRYITVDTGGISFNNKLPGIEYMANLTIKLNIPKEAFTGMTQDKAGFALIGAAENNAISFPNEGKRANYFVNFLTCERESSIGNGCTKTITVPVAYVPPETLSASDSGDIKVSAEVIINKDQITRIDTLQTTNKELIYGTNTTIPDYETILEENTAPEPAKPVSEKYTEGTVEGTAAATTITDPMEQAIHDNLLKSQQQFEATAQSQGERLAGQAGLVSNRLINFANEVPKQVTSVNDLVFVIAGLMAVLLLIALIIVTYLYLKNREKKSRLKKKHGKQENMKIKNPDIELD